MKLLRLILLLCCLALTIACSENHSSTTSASSSGNPTPPGVTNKETWTIVYYMSSSNDLKNNAGHLWDEKLFSQYLYGLYEFKRGTYYPSELPEGVNIIVFYDNRYKLSDDAYRFDADNPAKSLGTTVTTISKKDSKISFTTTQWEDWIRSEGKPEWGPMDSGEVKTFKAFIEKVFEKSPTDRYMLLMWDHGFGLNGLNIDYTSTGNGDKIRINEFGNALRDLKVATGKSFDILAFDNCLMGQFEVAYELKDTGVRYMVANEQEGAAYDIPVVGFLVDFPDSKEYKLNPYIYQNEQGLLDWLIYIHKRPVRETARLLAYQIDAAQWAAKGARGNEAWVALDLEEFFKVDGTADRFFAFASKLYNGLNHPTYSDSFSGLVSEAKLKAQSMSGVNQDVLNKPLEQDNYRDLRDFAKNLSDVGSTYSSDIANLIKPEADRLYDSLQPASMTNLDDKRTVLYNSRIARPSGRFSGLSVLLQSYDDQPEPVKYYYWTSYQNLLLYKDSRNGHKGSDMWNFLVQAKLW